eukprot:4021376-Amphidinium_carterae.1
MESGNGCFLQSGAIKFNRPSPLGNSGCCPPGCSNGDVLAESCVFDRLFSFLALKTVRTHRAMGLNTGGISVPQK